MTAEVPTTEPAALRVGATWKWRRLDLTDYPSSAWTLKYWFKQATSSGARFSVTATAYGDGYEASVAAATTATYTADDYTWAAFVEGGSSEVYEVDSGTCLLLPKYNADAALDDRTHARKMLDAVESALEALTSLGVKSYQIGSRILTRRDLSELLDLRAKYRAEVFAERLAENARNGRQGGKLTVTF